MVDDPEQTFTALELMRFNGERGQRALIAFRGAVYDVTDCPQWRTGLHKNLHFAGIDLTDALSEAPHAADVFTRPCVKRVGRLVP
jgi:predicted heme/steroid binding protein